MIKQGQLLPRTTISTGSVDGEFERLLLQSTSVARLTVYKCILNTIIPSVCPGRHIAENFIFLWTSNFLQFFDVDQPDKVSLDYCLKMPAETRFTTNLVRYVSNGLEIPKPVYNFELCIFKCARAIYVQDFSEIPSS